MSEAASPQISRLPLWAAVAAVLGGALWSVKSLGILLFNVQPEYTFELAPVCFSAATLGVARVCESNRSHPGWPASLAWLATVAGAIAAVAYIVREDSLVFGMATMIAVLTSLGVLLYTGRHIWQSQALGQWSAMPWVLAGVTIAGVPVGGALEAVDERLLEVPLLVLGMSWIVLAASALPVNERATYETKS